MHLHQSIVFSKHFLIFYHTKFEKRLVNKNTRFSNAINSKFDVTKNIVVAINIKTHFGNYLPLYTNQNYSQCLNAAAQQKNDFVLARYKQIKQKIKTDTDKKAGSLVVHYTVSC